VHFSDPASVTCATDCLCQMSALTTRLIARVWLQVDSLLVGYILAFNRDAAYDGEEFLKFRLIIPKPYLYIDQVAVATQSKGLGVGRAPYGAVEAIAHREGAQALCCEVNISPPNLESMAFHEALGFQRMESLVTLDGRRVELLLKEVV